MAGKHSADDDFNPYRSQKSKQSGENKSKGSTKKNYNQDYGRSVKNSSNRTIKGKTGEIEDQRKSQGRKNLRLFF